MHPAHLLLVSLAFVAAWAAIYAIAHLLTRKPDTRPTTPPKSRTAELYDDPCPRCHAYQLSPKVTLGEPQSECWRCGAPLTIPVDVTEAPVVDEREAS